MYNLWRDRAEVSEGGKFTPVKVRRISETTKCEGAKKIARGHFSGKREGTQMRRHMGKGHHVPLFRPILSFLRLTDSKVPFYLPSTTFSLPSRCLSLSLSRKPSRGVLSCLIVLACLVLCGMPTCWVVLCCFLLCAALSCLVLLRLALSSVVLSCLVLSCMFPGPANELQGRGMGLYPLVSTVTSKRAR